MLPSVPVSVWEQIAVVIVFAFLLAGLGWVLVRLFIQAIADVNAHYSQLLKDTNVQWQQYFDARAESSNQVSKQMMERMDDVASILANLVSDFEAHDRFERQALDLLDSRRARSLRKEQ
jgi:predicted PurR-regulated permease PerM